MSLMYRSLTTETFLTDWKTAKIQPLQKSGVSDQFGNYIPLSILPFISKIIEKAVHQQFVDYLHENKL